MKNLKFTLFTLSFLVLSHLNAQEESEFKNEFHLNSTRFIANYLNFGNNVNSNNPYLLGYKRVFNKSALRVGFMGNFNHLNYEVGPSHRNSNSYSAFDLRLGYEWRQDLHKKWSIFYGFDVASRIVSNQTTDFFSTTLDGKDITYRSISSTSDNNFGLGPVGGIQWNLSSRIALMAESRAYFFYRETYSIDKWKDVPEQWTNNNNTYDDVKSSTSFYTRFDFFLPLDIFIIIKL